MIRNSRPEMEKAQQILAGDSRRKFELRFLGNYEAEVRDTFFACRAGISVGSVLIDGAISACPSIRADYHQGNIYENDFMEVWNHRFKPYRDREWMKKDECADCKYFRFCKGNGMHLRDENGDLLFCHLKRLQTP